MEKYKCNKTGKKAVRETDTLDTFFDSSWYFLRFCSPIEETVPFKEDDTSYWMPVDIILVVLNMRFFIFFILGSFQGHSNIAIIMFLKNHLKN